MEEHEKSHQQTHTQNTRELRRLINNIEAVMHSKEIPITNTHARAEENAPTTKKETIGRTD